MANGAGTGLGVFCAFLSSVTWAIGSAVYSRLSREHSAFAVNLSRTFVAFPLFLISAFVVSGGVGEGIAALRAVTSSQFGWFTLSMLASYGFGDVLFLLSTRTLGVPGALAIASCYPIWTALAGFLFQGQTLALGQISGLALTVAGVVAVILATEHPAGAGGTEGVGLAGGAPVAGGPGQGVAIALALATSVFWSMNSYSVFRAGLSVPMAVCNTIRMGLALGCNVLMGRLFARGRPPALPLRELRRWWWAFLIEAYLGSSVFMYGLAHTSLAAGSTLSSLAPVVSVPVAVAMGLERFSWRRAGGVVAVLLGLRLLMGD